MYPHPVPNWPFPIWKDYPAPKLFHSHAMSQYFEGANIRPKNLFDAHKLIGKRVKYLRHSDIDRSGRGYFFPRTGTVIGAAGRNIQIDDDWVGFSEIVEMIEIQSATLAKKPPLPDAPF